MLKKYKKIDKRTAMILKRMIEEKNINKNLLAVKIGILPSVFDKMLESIETIKDDDILLLIQILELEDKEQLKLIKAHMLDKISNRLSKIYEQLENKNIHNP